MLKLQHEGLTQDVGCTTSAGGNRCLRAQTLEDTYLSQAGRSSGHEALLGGGTWTPCRQCERSASAARAVAVAALRRVSAQHGSLHLSPR